MKIFIKKIFIIDLNVLIKLLILPLLVSCQMKTSLQTKSNTSSSLSNYKFESSPDGNGSELKTPTVDSNSTTQFYFIIRDEVGNYIDNPAVDWSIESGTGNLTLLENGKGVQFVSSSTGIVKIQARHQGQLAATIEIHVVAPSDGGASPSATNAITVSNLVFSNTSSTGFTAALSFSGDDNNDADLTLYYCNETDSPGCDPIATGISVLMTRLTSTYASTISSLSSPYDANDVLNISVVASDMDGTTGSPLSSTVSLALNTGITLLKVKTNSPSVVTTYNSIDVFVEVSGDNEGNATGTLYYCNITDNPMCDPMSGSSIALTRGTHSYSTEEGLRGVISGLTSPNDPGDELAVVVVASDAGGVTGSPMSGSIWQPQRFRLVPNELPGFTSLPSNSLTSVRVSNTGRVYVASSVYGLVYSDDDGLTWSASGGYKQGLTNYTLNDLFVSGTTVAVSTFACSFVSTDGSANWLKSGCSPNGHNIGHSFWVHGTTYFRGTQSGLAVSTNSGTSWIVRTVASNGMPHDFVDGIYYESVSSKLYAATSGGLGVSSDHGLTWTKFSTTEGVVNNTVRNVWLDSSKIYLATAGGLSISADNGATWTNYTTTQGIANNSVYDVYASGNNIYLATNGGVSISTNGGTNWTNYTVASHGLVSNSTRSIAVIGTKIFVATTAGLSKSTNSGTSWTNVTNSGALPTMGFNDVAKVTSDLYLASSSGLSKSTNGGLSWTTKTTADGLINNTVNKLKYKNSKLYIATGGGLSVTADGAGTFTNYTTVQGIVNNNVKSIDVVGSSIYLGTAGGLSISTNDGSTWTNYTIASNGLVNNNVQALSVSSTGRICLGTAAGISWSDNGGTSWTNKSDFNNNDVKTIYCEGAKIYVGTFSRMQLSTDNGSTWTTLSTQNGFSTNIVNFITEISGVIYSGNGNFSISRNGVDFMEHPTTTGSGGQVRGMVLESSIFYIATAGGFVISY